MCEVKVLTKNLPDDPSIYRSAEFPQPDALGATAVKESIPAFG